MKLFASLLLTIAGLAAAEEDWGSSNVVEIGDEDWDSYRGKNPKFLSVFYAPWCGHCKVRPRPSRPIHHTLCATVLFSSPLPLLPLLQALKQPYGEAAAELQFRVPLVAVNCVVRTGWYFAQPKEV